MLNKTNANMISEIAGSDETEDWTGIPVCLFVTRVDYQGKRVDALRIDYPDNNKPPVSQANGTGAAKQSAPVDNTNWKLELSAKLKEHCAKNKLDWDKEKLNLLATFAGTDNFAVLTPAQAKQGCANLEDPNFLPF